MGWRGFPLPADVAIPVLWECVSPMPDTCPVSPLSPNPPSALMRCPKVPTRHLWPATMCASCPACPMCMEVDLCHWAPHTTALRRRRRRRRRRRGRRRKARPPPCPALPAAAAREGGTDPPALRAAAGAGPAGSPGEPAAAERLRCVCHTTPAELFKVTGLAGLCLCLFMSPRELAGAAGQR